MSSISFLNEKFFFCKVQNPTSKYRGVSWKKSEKCWQVQLQHNKKKYFGGYFDNEEHSAMKVNLICDKTEIERKNPMINIDLDGIQKVIHLLFIAHGKVSELPLLFIKQNFAKSCFLWYVGAQKQY